MVEVKLLDKVVVILVHKRLVKHRFQMLLTF